MRDEYKFLTYTKFIAVFSLVSLLYQQSYSYYTPVQETKPSLQNISRNRLSSAQTNCASEKRKTSKVEDEKSITQKKSTLKLVDYISIGMGFSRPRISNSFIPSDVQMSEIQVVAIGKNINDFISTEIAFNYSPEHYKKSQIQDFEFASVYASKMIFLNGYVNLLSAQHSNIYPFITLGLGLTYNSTRHINSNFPPSTVLTYTSKIIKTTDSISAAWQFGFGGIFKLNNLLKLSVSYNYMNRGDFNTSLFNQNNKVETQISDHITLLKLVIDL